MKNDDEIVLWFGDIGSKLDKYGNVYTVRRNEPNDPTYMHQALVKMYQSFLRQRGYKVEVSETTIHEATGDYTVFSHTITKPEIGLVTNIVYKLPKF